MPSNAIELYLRSIGYQLRALPADLRSAELAELRAHLLALAADYQAQGMDMDTAAKNAVAQFGPAHGLGRQLRRSHQRSTRSAAVAVLALLGYLVALAVVLTWLRVTSSAETLPLQIVGAVLLPLPILLLRRRRQRRSA